jgi:hypothetical protein
MCYDRIRGHVLEPEVYSPPGVRFAGAVNV